MTKHEEGAMSLDDVLAHVRFVDEERVSIHGHEHAVPPRQNRFITVREGYPRIVGSIAQYLYDLHYTQQDEGRGSYRFVFDRLLRQEYLESMALAAGRGPCWQPGWRSIELLPSGERRVTDGRREAVARAEDLQEQPDGTFRMRVGRASSIQQQGWLHVRGLVDHASSGPGTLRLYFNPSRAGALPLLSSVVGQLDGRGVPFHFKIADDPQGFRRADGAVLYFAAADWPKVAEALVDIHAAVVPYLKRPTPLFAKPLAPGVALAEDPPGGESFGMSRCRLTAQALWRAHEEGVADAEVPAFVRARFLAEGYPWDRLHLNPGNAADHHVELKPWIRGLPDLPEAAVAVEVPS